MTYFRRDLDSKENWFLNIYISAYEKKATFLELQTCRVNKKKLQVQLRAKASNNSWPWTWVQAQFIFLICAPYLWLYVILHLIRKKALHIWMLTYTQHMSESELLWIIRLSKNSQRVPSTNLTQSPHSFNKYWLITHKCQAFEQVQGQHQAPCPPGSGEVRGEVLRISHW